MSPWLLVVLSLANPGDTTRGTDLSFDLCLVRELHQIPEVDTWTYCEPTAYPAATGRVAAAWPAIARQVQPHVTAAVVRRLSKYSQPQMKGYQKVPSFAKVTLHPRAQHRDGAFVVFAGQVDTLPTHSPIVKRWLKVYVLYNAATEAVERVTVTVRGQVEE